MSQTRICPNCRSTVPTDAPEGVCPACALRAGFSVDDPAEAPTRASSPPGEPLPPEEIARRLPELENFVLIGHGGMGAVYRAHHTKLDRAVAVKVLDPALQHDSAFADRFTREARTMAQLDHPNVVRVYDVGHRDDLYYLVMEFVDGVNLRQTIEAGTLSPERALTMVPKICEALQYAHDQGVVHRDIKPENILLDRKGAIKIADFGLAKLSGEAANQRLTRTQQIMGTPHYMAPEQIEKPEQVDHRADIYALGVVFYELLTGELPVGRFPPPSQKVEVDVRLDDVVLRTLEKEPSLRYQQASQLQTEVEAYSRGDYTPERVPDFEYKSEKTLFGLPLIHICSSRDPKGRRMRVAKGIIAIGDVAVGGIAIGAFSFGGITFGGISAGLFAFSGLTLGLLTAVGGISFGGIAFGGFAAGLLSFGGMPLRMFELGAETFNPVKLLTISVWTVCISTGVAAAIIAWSASGPERERRRRLFRRNR